MNGIFCTPVGKICGASGCRDDMKCRFAAAATGVSGKIDLAVQNALPKVIAGIFFRPSFAANIDYSQIAKLIVKDQPHEKAKQI
jgi:hypothetical protein